MPCCLLARAGACPGPLSAAFQAPCCACLLALHLLVGLHQGLAEHLDVHRFLEEGKGPQPHADILVLLGPVTGKDDDLDIGIGGLDLAQDLDAVDARHLQVEDHHLRFFFLDHVQGRLAVVGHRRAHVAHDQALGQGLDEIPLVVDQQYAARGLEIVFAVDVRLVEIFADPGGHRRNARDLFVDRFQFFFEAGQHQHVLVDGQGHRALAGIDADVVSLLGQFDLDLGGKQVVVEDRLGMGGPGDHSAAGLFDDQRCGFDHGGLVHRDDDVIEGGGPRVIAPLEHFQQGGEVLVLLADGRAAPSFSGAGPSRCIAS